MKTIIEKNIEDLKNEQLKAAVFASDHEKFFKLTALMKRQITLNNMKISHK